MFQFDLAVVQKDLASGVSGATLQQDFKALDNAFVDLIRAEVRFAFDTRADQGVHASSHPDLDDLFAILGHHDDGV